MIKTTFTITLLALAISPSFAQEKTVETLKESDVERVEVIGSPSRFGATKSEIPIAEIPRSVSIITSKDFLERGALDLSATVDYTAGITGNNFGPATRSDTFTIRGLDAPQYQDNLQVNFGNNNNTRADIYTLEQVEVLKGPASVLYGQAAPGGIVSSVSKVASSSHQDNELVITAGNNSRYQASLDLTTDLSGDGTWTARVVGVYRDSDTQIDFVKDDAIVIAPSITYENDSTTITALINYTDRESDTSSQFLPLAVTACQTDDVFISEANVCAFAPDEQVDSSTYVGDPNFNRFDTESITVSLFGSHEFNDTFSFDGTVRYRDNEAHYLQTWISFPTTLGLTDGNARVLSDGTALARTFFGGPAGSDQFAFDFRLGANFSTGIAQHQVTAGLNYQDVDTFADQTFGLTFPTTFNIFNPVYDGSEIPADDEMFDASSSDNTKASDVYLIDHITIGNLVFNLGVRYSSVDSEDDVSDQSDNETPLSIGALYKTDFGLNPYVSYSESFRATVGTDVITGTSLLPRTGEQFEVGFKYQSSNNGSFITVAYFDLEEDNLIEFVALGRTQAGLSIDADGIEVEALINVADFSFDFAFQHQESNEVDQNGIETTRPSIPDTTASLWSTWSPSQGSITGLKMGVGIRYADENESNGTTVLASNNFETTPVQIITDGYTVFDFFASYEFSDALSANINVRNLADKKYYSTCLVRGDCFPGEERTIVGSVNYRF